MAEIFGYPYLIEGNASNQTLIGVSGSVPDMNSQLGTQYSSLERLRRIQKFILRYSSKKRKYNILAVSGKNLPGGNNPKFMDLESDGSITKNKDQRNLRVNEFMKFYQEVCSRNKWRPESNVLVGTTDASIFAIYLGMAFPKTFNTIVLISPTEEFYVHFYKFLASKPSDSLKKEPFKDLNIFLYSKKDRYKFNQYANPAYVAAQNGFLDLMEKKRLAKNFFYHFKSEGIKNYKMDIDEFILSPKYGKTREFDMGNHKYKLAG